jgi:uncharacterized protein (TIGR02444 family)
MIIAADSTEQAETNPFWTFSVTLYKKPGVAQALLDLQDSHGLDVNILLYACFAAVEQRTVSEVDASALDGVCADWRDEVIRQLRSVRRKLAARPDTADISKGLLQLELAAEQRQQAMIWAWHNGTSARISTLAPEACLQSNLQSVAMAAGAVDAASLLAPLLAVLRRVLLPQD